MVHGVIVASQFHLIINIRGDAAICAHYSSRKRLFAGKRFFIYSGQCDSNGAVSRKFQSYDILLFHRFLPVESKYDNENTKKWL
jgi:hypothetical protein